MSELGGGITDILVLLIPFSTILWYNLGDGGGYPHIRLNFSK